jgi:LacI family transcriptional regulator
VKQSRFTMRDAAREAGVSVATISRCLNSADQVSLETREKVRQAMQRLQFEPNRLASSLKSNRSSMVGVVVPDITNPFFVGIIRSAENVLKTYGYAVLIGDTNENPAREHEYLRDFFSRRIDGLIIIPAIEHGKIPTILKGRHVPTVFVDRYLSDKFDCVKSNNQAGISLLLSHLLEKGYRRIGFISGPQETLPGRERYEAFQAMLRLYKLPRNENWIRFCDFSIEGGYRATADLLRQPSVPEAIVASNNLTGIGALRAMHNAGLKLPEEIGLVVFDEVVLGDVTDPPLTVVAQPSEEIGAEAARILLRRMRGEESLPPQLIVHEPKLVVRGSAKEIKHNSRPPRRTDLAGGR